METVKLVTFVEADGTLRQAVGQQFANQPVEVVLVLQPVEQADPLRMGYPMDYFARLDAIAADDLTVREDQGHIDSRLPLE